MRIKDKYAEATLLEKIKYIFNQFLNWLNDENDLHIGE